MHPDALGSTGKAHTSQLSKGKQLRIVITPHFMPSSSSVSSVVPLLVCAAPVNSGKLEIPMFTAMARLTLPTNSVLNRLPESATSYTGVGRALGAINLQCARRCRLQRSC